MLKISKWVDSTSMDRYVQQSSVQFKRLFGHFEFVVIVSDDIWYKDHICIKLALMLKFTMKIQFDFIQEMDQITSITCFLSKAHFAKCTHTHKHIFVLV